MAFRLLINFLRNNDVSVLARTRIIRSMLVSHPYYHSPLPPGVLTPDQIGERIDLLQAACDQAATHDTLKIRERNKVRLQFNDEIRNLARHLEIFANGDPALLENTGFELQTPKKKNSPLDGQLPAPVVVTKHGPSSGTMIVSISVLRGAAIYEVHQTTGDPTQETNWSRVGMFVNPFKNQISGRTPGLFYWTRARGIGTNGDGAWSAPFPLMSL